MPRVKSVTVRDLALRAGVSIGTVSRVLNGYANISPQNSERVKKAIEETNYGRAQLDSEGASRRRRSRVQKGNIGVVFADMDELSPLLGPFANGVERACAERGSHAFIELPSDRNKVPRCVQERKVDGLLIKTVGELPKFAEALSAEIPVVFIGFSGTPVPVLQVGADNYGAGWTITEYLWNRGHRLIAFFSDQVLHSSILPRLQGYEGFLRAQNASDTALAILTNGPVTRDQRGRVAEEARLHFLVEKFLALPARPTAVITQNDRMAHMLYGLFAQHGLRVPDDISVIGFDNDAESDTCHPRLTSYALPFGQISYHATLELFDRIEEPGRRLDNSIHLVRGQLIERDSVRDIAEASSATEPSPVSMA